MASLAWQKDALAITERDSTDALGLMPPSCLYFNLHPTFQRNEQLFARSRGMPVHCAAGLEHHRACPQPGSAAWQQPPCPNIRTQANDPSSFHLV
jgi:hypothetical protein